MQSSSLTDRDDWRAFALAAADDLTLLDRDPDRVLEDVTGAKSFREDRYERVTDELVDRFGPLLGMSVLELGAGYGGQAFSILCRYSSVRYSIIDLPEPRKLARVFLREHGGYQLFPDPTYPSLAISNYAVSELRRTDQIAALLTLGRASRGYIRWNGWVTGELELDEFVSMCPPGARAEQVDDDRDENRLIVWGPRW